MGLTYRTARIFFKLKINNNYYKFTCLARPVAFGVFPDRITFKIINEPTLIQDRGTKYNDLKEFGYINFIDMLKNNIEKLEYSINQNYGNYTNIKGFVYIISCGDYIKIGCSANPERRIDTLNTIIPYYIDLVYKIESNNMYALERQLQYQFKKNRIKGEWFYYSQEIKDFIAKLQAAPENPIQT